MAIALSRVASLHLDRAVCCIRVQVFRQSIVFAVHSVYVLGHGRAQLVYILCRICVHFGPYYTQHRDAGGPFLCFMLLSSFRSKLNKALCPFGLRSICFQLLTSSILYIVYVSLWSIVYVLSRSIWSIFSVVSTVNLSLFYTVQLV